LNLRGKEERDMTTIRDLKATIADLEDALEATTEERDSLKNALSGITDLALEAVGDEDEFEDDQLEDE
jgi:hypothetical protein